MSIQPQQEESSDTSSSVRGLQDINEWKYVWPHIKRVISRDDRYNEEDIIKLLIDKKIQAWYSERFAFITEIQIFPKAKVLNIFMLGGDLSCLTFLRDLEKWAKDMGCTHIEESGRIGWVKVLGEYGYKLASVTMRKEL